MFRKSLLQMNLPLTFGQFSAIVRELVVELRSAATLAYTNGDEAVRLARSK